MYIGKPFSWTPSAFEGASGICNIKRLARVSGAYSIETCVCEPCRREFWMQEVE